MELYEANRILRTVKAAISADGYKLPSSAETDGLLMLLGKLDIEKHLAPKIKHARAQAKQPKSAAAYARSCKLIYFFRALQAVNDSLPDPVTALSMTMLHKAIAGDINDDAGKLRTVDASTDGNAHTDPKYVSGSVKSIIAKMNDIPAAPTTAKDDFAGYLSHYMRELIILHPFESCSEFTVRIFIFMFCRLKGFALAYHRATPPVVKAAEQTAFTTDDVAPLFAMFTECLSYDYKKPEPEKPSAPRTRREVAKDLCRPTRSKKETPPPAEQPKQKPEKTKTQTQKQKDKDTAKKEKDAAKKEAANDDVIKRAVRLQQKISKLNEQLTELIKPLDGKDEN
ncbi:MAG: Fic family protein [Clostridiales bacterium]|nr:Fic family protein [Clostridiales bacterium]